MSDCKLRSAVLLMLAILCLPSLQAQTYKILHQFDPYNAIGPEGAVIIDSAGNLYFTASGGFVSFGNVLELNTAGKINVLYSFTNGGLNGSLPLGGLVRDSAGTLYGTTLDGGDSFASCNPSCGVIYKLDTAGIETVLYSFTGGSDGAFPHAGLVRDQAGNLYGTASNGGMHNSTCDPAGCGVVFKLDSAGAYSVLYSFTGGNDGGVPLAALILDSSGNLYGTASLGGNLTCTGSSSCGVVFAIDSANKYTVLYSFAGGAQGFSPESSLVRDGAGNLYGSTYYGGDLSCNNGIGCGTAFKLDTSGNLTTLHRFAGEPDGAFPTGLLRDESGNLYGMTTIGGGGCTLPGCGTVFKLGPSRNETILYSFKGPLNHDGSHPVAALIMDEAGNLYGTTPYTVFEVGR